MFYIFDFQESEWCWQCFDRTIPERLMNDFLFFTDPPRRRETVSKKRKTKFITE